MLRGDAVDWIQPDTLESVVRRAVGHPEFAIKNWQIEPIQAGFGGGLGVFGLTGDGMNSQGPHSWSVVLKVLGPSLDAGPEIESSH